MNLQEKTPPNFPKKLHDKILNQYKGEEDKAYATMWKIFYEKEKGHKKVNEMWMAWQETNEAEDQNAEHDETDLTNPEESKEVELAKKIQDLVKEFLAIHGVTEEEEQPEEIKEEAGEEDMSNAEEQKEVSIAREIKSLADELLAMHGVEDEEGDNDEDDKNDMGDMGDEDKDQKPVAEATHSPYEASKKAHGLTSSAKSKSEHMAAADAHDAAADAHKAAGNTEKEKEHDKLAKHHYGTAYTMGGKDKSNFGWQD